MIENVRLVPKTASGALNFNGDLQDVLWLSDESVPLNLKACKSVFIDLISSTALISYIGQTKLLHFLDGEDSVRMFVYMLEHEMGSFMHKKNNSVTDDKFVLFESTIQHQQSNLMESELDEATLNVLEAFSKVPQLAKGLLGKLQGKQQNLRRPRGIGKSAIPVNPWIFDRPLNLPESRLSCGPISPIENFSQLDPLTQATMVYNSTGRVISQASRPQFWINCLRKETIKGANDCVTLSENVVRIEKDLCRLGEGDETVLKRVDFILQRYSRLDAKVGYVQGMADLALPFARLIEDDEVGFECFHELMKPLRDNFLDVSEHQQEEWGMSKQLGRLRDAISETNPILCDYLKFNRDSDNLFFAYRWLLVLFRREFTVEEGDRLWDVMFAASVAGIARIEDYSIYLALAMITITRDTFMQSCSRFEDILIVNDLSLLKFF